MKYWTCPECGISNPIHLRLCQHCRYIRRQTDVTRKTLNFWKCEWCGVLNVITRYVCRGCYQTRYRAQSQTLEEKKEMGPHQV
ncbi:MAG: hypothetical protein Q6364_09485 [Candidatus Hermodarchaeota archaeon]|nr:hypothetical protein [Candidatus Hermodarchaeota archaeon]